MKAAENRKRFIVTKAKGLFGAMRWHVWDTQPDFCEGHSRMEADDKAPCEEHAEELNAANYPRRGPHILKSGTSRTTLCGAPSTDEDLTIYLAGCKTNYGHVRCGGCLAILRAMGEEEDHE